MALNPQIQSGVGYENPVGGVEEPSALGALSNLGEAAARGFFNANRSSLDPKESAVDRRNAQEQARIVGLEKSLRDNEQMRGQIGDRKAQMRENAILRNYALDGGDLSDASTQEVYKLSTGRDYERAGLTIEQIAVNEFMGDSANTQYIMAAKYELGNEASEEELLQLAMTNKAAKDAHTIKMQNRGIGWEAGRRDATIGVINEFRNQQVGTLQFLASQMDYVDATVLQQGKLNWATQKATISSTLTPEELQQIQPHFEMVEQTFTLLETMAGVEGMTTKLMSNVISGVQKSIDAGNLSGMEGVALLNAFEKQNLEFLMDFAGSDPSKISEYLNTMDSAVPVNPADPASERMFDDVDSGSLFNKINVANQNQGKPRSTEVKVQELSTAFSGMKAIGADHRRFTSVAGIDRTFNGTVKKEIADIAKENPDQALSLTRLGVEALDAQRAVAFQVMRQMEEANLTFVNQKTGQLEVTRDMLIQNTFSEADADRFVAAANKYYNGSLTAMALDNASALSYSDKRAITRMGLFTSLGKTVKDLQNQKALINRFDQEIKSFMDLEKTFTGSDGDTELQGGAGNDDLSMVAMSSSNYTGALGNGPIAQSLGIDFASYEKEAGLPTGYLETMAFIESRGNPNAKNPDSTAGGLFQQLDSNAKQYGVEDKYNPIQSTEGAVRFAIENRDKYVARMGREPEGWELYVMHQQGGAGGMKLLAAKDDSANAIEVLGRDQVLLNGGNESTTVGGFKKIWQNKYNRVANSRGFSDKPIRPMDRGQGKDQIEGVDVLETSGGVDLMASDSTSGPSDSQPAPSGGSPTSAAPSESLRPAERTEAAIISAEEFGRLSAETQAMLERLGIRVA